MNSIIVFRCHNPHFIDEEWCYLFHSVGSLPPNNSNMFNSSNFVAVKDVDTHGCVTDVRHLSDANPSTGVAEL